MTAFLKTVKRSVANELRRGRFASEAAQAFRADWIRFRRHAGSPRRDPASITTWHGDAT